MFMNVLHDDAKLLYMGVWWSAAGVTPSLLPEKTTEGTVTLVADVIEETPFVEDSAGANPIKVFKLTFPLPHNESAAKKAALY